MACNFRAAMPQRLHFLLAIALAAGPALAEKADRSKPMVFTADRQGRLDGVNQRLELMGNVIEPEQVGDTVCFLASARAGQLSGVVLNLGA